MEHLQVARVRPSRLAGGLDVVDFQLVLHHEEESTRGTAATLRPEESPEGGSGLRVMLQALRPVHQGAIIEGRRLAHLDVATNRRLGMATERAAGGTSEVPAAMRARAPLAGRDPPSRFGGVPVTGPAA